MSEAAHNHKRGSQPQVIGVKGESFRVSHENGGATRRELGAPLPCSAPLTLLELANHPSHALKWSAVRDFPRYLWSSRYHSGRSTDTCRTNVRGRNPQVPRYFLHLSANFPRCQLHRCSASPLWYLSRRSTVHRCPTLVAIGPGPIRVELFRSKITLTASPATLALRALASPHHPDFHRFDHNAPPDPMPSGDDFRVAQIQ